jgi:hypothetical protein
VRQSINEAHEIDESGNPAGGETGGVGILIRWQKGPLGRGADRKPPNGAFVETVIGAAIGRLEFYQMASGGRFACHENAMALEMLRGALMQLENRTAAREAREVEGTHTP